MVRCHYCMMDNKMNHLIQMNQIDAKKKKLIERLFSPSGIEDSSKQFVKKKTEQRQKANR